MADSDARTVIATTPGVECKDRDWRDTRCQMIVDERSDPDRSQMSRSPGSDRNDDTGAALLLPADIANADNVHYVN